LIEKVPFLSNQMWDQPLEQWDRSEQRFSNPGQPGADTVSRCRNGLQAGLFFPALGLDTSNERCTDQAIPPRVKYLCAENNDQMLERSK
jgi:hypothetical protein